MKRNQKYGTLLIAVLFSLSAIFTVVSPAYAAPDLTGKTVTDVSVTGNAVTPSEQILAVVKIKPGEVLAADKVKQDMQAIYEMGYFFDVVANFTEVPEGVKVIYTVMENPVVNSISIKGNTKVSSDKLMSMLAVTKGKILNTKTLNDNMRAIEQYYHDQGFILAKVSDTAMGEGGALTIAINEGALEGIVVKGNEKTKNYVITREMKLKPGEAFNVKDARRSMQKVYNLGYFEDVNMKLNPGKEPNAVILETTVVEQKTGTFSVGGGYSKADGMIGIIELGDNNFRGTGDKVKVHWEFGGSSTQYSHNKNYSLGYTRPWIDDKQTSLGFNIYNMTNQYSDYDNGNLRSTYYKKRQGWDITLGRVEGEYVQNFITLKNRKDVFVENVAQADGGGPVDYNNDPTYLKDNFGTTHSIEFMKVFDSRDNVFNPTEGRRFSLSAEFAGRVFGGDFDYNKFTAETRQYLKVGKEQVVALRFSAGFATGSMPEAGQFSVGGAETLRGYQDDEFKGNKMLTATAEYRFPIAKKVQGVVFGDVGNAWMGDGFKLNGLNAAVGVGVRVTTPIGPIRLDYAKGKEGARTHFSFGGQF